MTGSPDELVLRARARIGESPIGRGMVGTAGEAGSSPRASPIGSPFRPLVHHTSTVGAVPMWPIISNDVLKAKGVLFGSECGRGFSSEFHHQYLKSQPLSVGIFLPVRAGPRVLLGVPGQACGLRRSASQPVPGGDAPGSSTAEITCQDIVRTTTIRAFKISPEGHHEHPESFQDRAH